MTTIFAWPQFSDPWTLGLTATAGPAEVMVDGDARRVEASNDDWSELTMTFELASDEEWNQDEELAAYVLISLARTNTRIPVALAKDGDGRFGGEATIPRAMLAGVGEIVGQVVKTDPARLVGTSEPWTLVIDRGEAPPRKGLPPVAVRWMKFSAADAPFAAKAAKGSYSTVDLEGMEPVVYLNEDIEHFTWLMNSPKPRHEKRRLQMVVGTSIARQTTVALVREAQARIVVNEDDTVEPPTDSIYRDVLEAVAGQILDIEDVQELCERLGTPQAQTPTDRSRLWVTIENAIDRLTNHAEIVAESIRGVRDV